MAKTSNTPNKSERPNQNKTPHNFGIKPESDYTKGAHDEVGQDVRKSRQKAIKFQKEQAIDK